MTDDAETKYRDAYLKHRNAMKELQNVIRPIKFVSESAEYSLEKFATVYYGLQTKNYREHRRMSGETENPVEKWPDKDQVDLAFRSAAETFNTMRNLWGELTSGQQETLQKPPETSQSSP